MINEHVVEKGGRWYVYNRDRTKNLTPDGFATKAQAVKRLGQIEYFKNAREATTPFSKIHEGEKTFKPTASMSANAKRAKEMRDSVPDSEKGMTPVGLKRMNQLIDREPLSLDTVKRMYSFFSRHEVDKQSKEWKEGKSKGEQGWLGWGGDSGFSWARNILKQNGENLEEVACQYNEGASTDTALANKAKESGIALSKLKKVFKRGIGAWEVSPKKTPPEQWALARVNAFVEDYPNVRFDKDLV